MFSFKLGIIYVVRVLNWLVIYTVYNLSVAPPPSVYIYL